MSSVEQRARELFDRECPIDVARSGAAADIVRKAAIRAIAAALREQPEARGGVDGLSWELRQQAKHAGVVTGELLNKAADALDALTAAQQPVQEGGGEVEGICDCPLCEESRAEASDTAPPSAPSYRDAYEGAREDLLDWKGRAQRAEARLRGLGYTGIDASQPPSAPVGDRREIDRVIRELRACNPAADEYRGEHIHGVWAKELERALAQQPAQAAPGDARAIIEEFVQCAGVGRPPGKLIAQAQDWLAATPPGDDAAGGGQ